MKKIFLTLFVLLTAVSGFTSGTAVCFPANSSVPVNNVGNPVLRSAIVSPFAAAGGAAAGAGGFLAGAAGGAVGTAFSSPVLSMGNSAYFGDPMMTGKQYLMSIAGGALLGGTVNGITALANGRNFMTGNLPSNNAPITPTVTQPTQNAGTQQGQAQQQTTPPNQNNNNSFSVATTERPQVLSVEGQGLNINPPRPEITGYHPSLANKTDLYHNFPTMLDKTIIQGGEFSLTGNGGYWYSAPGMIESVKGIYNGWYTIGINQQGVIYHRCFYQVLPTVY